MIEKNRASSSYPAARPSIICRGPAPITNNFQRPSPPPSSSSNPPPASRQDVSIQSAGAGSTATIFGGVVIVADGDRRRNYPRAPSARQASCHPHKNPATLASKTVATCRLQYGAYVDNTSRSAAQICPGPKQVSADPEFRDLPGPAFHVSTGQYAT